MALVSLRLWISLILAIVCKADDEWQTEVLSCITKGQNYRLRCGGQKVLLIGWACSLTSMPTETGSQMTLDDLCPQSAGIHLTKQMIKECARKRNCQPCKGSRKYYTMAVSHACVPADSIKDVCDLSNNDLPLGQSYHMHIVTKNYPKNYPSCAISGCSCKSTITADPKSTFLVQYRVHHLWTTTGVFGSCLDYLKIQDESKVCGTGKRYGWQIIRTTSEFITYYRNSRLSFSGNLGFLLEVYVTYPSLPTTPWRTWTTVQSTLRPSTRRAIPYSPRKSSVTPTPQYEHPGTASNGSAATHMPSLVNKGKNMYPVTFGSILAALLLIIVAAVGIVCFLRVRNDDSDIGKGIIFNNTYNIAAVESTENPYMDIDTLDAGNQHTPLNSHYSMCNVENTNTRTGSNRFVVIVNRVQGIVRFFKRNTPDYEYAGPPCGSGASTSQQRGSSLTAEDTENIYWPVGEAVVQPRGSNTELQGATANPEKSYVYDYAELPYTPTSQQYDPDDSHVYCTMRNSSTESKNTQNQTKQSIRVAPPRMKKKNKKQKNSTATANKTPNAAQNGQDAASNARPDSGQANSLMADSVTESPYSVPTSPHIVVSRPSTSTEDPYATPSDLQVEEQMLENPYDMPKSPTTRLQSPDMPENPYAMPDSPEGQKYVQEHLIQKSDDEMLFPKPCQQEESVELYKNALDCKLYSNI